MGSWRSLSPLGTQKYSFASCSSVRRGWKASRRLRSWAMRSPATWGTRPRRHARETASADIAVYTGLHGQEAAGRAPPCKKEACLACRKAQLPAACLTALRRIHRRSKARRARGIGVVAAVRAGPVSAHKQRVLGGAACRRIEGAVNCTVRSS